MGVYIKTKDGLKKVSVDSGNTDSTPAEVTAESIKNALGYTPANAANIANIEDDESGEYYIVDKDGNIIFKIDADGLHTTAIEAKSLTLNGEAVVPGGTSSGDGGSNEGGVVTIPSELTDHVASKSNPHGVTAAQVGLDKVENTSDADKPVSTAQRAALNALRNALSEQIVSASEEFHIVDEVGNIVATIDADGVHTTAVETESLAVSGKRQANIELIDDDLVFAKVARVEDGVDLSVAKGKRLIVPSSDGKGVYAVSETTDIDNPILSFYGTDDDNPVILRSIRLPVRNDDAANKQYVDDTFAGASGSTEGYGTRGLEYTLSNDKTTYSCSGIGTATAVKQLVIPYTYKGLPVVSIGLTAFQNNTVIESVSIPDSVTTIGIAAFEKCSNLRKVNIGNGLLELGNRAFQECASLTEVILPEGLTTIGLNAFVKCTALERVYIPKSATTVGTTLFTNCTNLTVYCGASAAASDWKSAWNDANRPIVWGVKAATPTRVLEAGSAYALSSGSTQLSVSGTRFPVSLELGHAYAITFVETAAEDAQTVMLYYGDAIASGHRSTLSDRSRGCFYTVVNGVWGISFYDYSSGTASITPARVYIRKL